MLFANNCNTTLNGGITAIATSMVVTSATGFPIPTGSQYFYCTLADAATQTTIEIVKVTAVSGTTFTIVRGQDGTTGTIFASGAVVSLRLVAASLNDFPKLDEVNTFTGLITASGGVAGALNGTVGATTATTGAFTTVAASTSVTTPIVQASNSGGLALKNSGGTTQMSVGAGGGDNMSINVSTNLNGTNAQIDISPTGTGHVHINPTGSGSVEIKPTNVGTMDNMTIGATTAKNGSFVDLSVTGTTSFDGAQGTAGQVLTSAGTGNTPTWTTPTTGTVTSVTGTAPVVSSGGSTPAISMAAATTSVNGYLTSTDWNTFNGKAPAFTYTTNYVPYGQGTTTPTQSANLTFDGTILTSTGFSGPHNGTVGATTAASGKFTTLGATGVVNFGVATGTELLNIWSNGRAFSTLSRADTNANPPVFQMLKARGSQTAKTTVATGDSLGQIQWSGYDGTTALTSGTISCVAEGAIATNSLGAGLYFYLTTAGAASNTLKMTLNNAGQLLLGATASGTYKLIVGTDIFINGINVGLGGGSLSSNTSLGSSALGSNTTGTRSTALGFFAGSVSNASFNCYVGSYSGIYNTGQQNTGIGDFALAGTSGSSTGGSNTAVGQSSQQLLTTGGNNNSLGVSTLSNLTTGSYNVAVGDSSLISAVTTNYNTAIGALSLRSYTGTGINVAVGFQSQYTSTSGSSNSSLGYGSLFANSTGSNNTAIGESSLGSTTASNNTGLGHQAGTNITSGSNNVCLGYQSGTDALVNITTASNIVVLGNNSTTTLYCKTSTITTSDIRDKTNIRPVSLGLDFVNKVNPIAYKFKTSREDDTPASRTYLGWSAQDVLANQGDENIVEDSDPDNLKMSGMDMVAVLWKAVQQLSAELEVLKQK